VRHPGLRRVHANEVISKAMDYIEDHVDGWVTDIQVEIL